MTNRSPTAPYRVSAELAAGASATLFADLCTIDRSLPDIVDAVLGELHRHDSSLVRCWRDAGVLSRVEAYCLHFLVPFHDLLQPAPPSEVALLSAQLLSCLAWRAYDNAVDGHEPPRIAQGRSVVACLRLVHYVESAFGIRAAHCVTDVEGHYLLMADQLDRETRDPVPVDEIWKRSSIFLYVPESLAKLDDARLRLFRDYINYAGLAHDLSDIMSDIATGVVSLPIRWLSEVADSGLINVAAIERLYERARQAVRPIEDHLSAAETRERHPVLCRLVANARAVLHGC